MAETEKSLDGLELSKVRLSNKWLGWQRPPSPRDKTPKCNDVVSLKNDVWLRS